jgi:hypothetical protein
VPNHRQVSPATVTRVQIAECFGTRTGAGFEPRVHTVFSRQRRRFPHHGPLQRLSDVRTLVRA